MLVEPSFWAGRRVLVTGHTGFKGAWLTLWLRALGAEVTGLSRGVPTAPSLFELAGVERDATTVEADVRDAAAVAAAVAEHRPQVVFHLAAQPLVRRAFAEPAETFAVNALGTVHVLEAVRAAGGAEAVVVVTTDKVYDNREWEWGYREDDALGGHEPYASSKACAELVATTYRAAYGLPVASARAGNVIGGGDWGADRLVPDVMRAALAGEAVELRRPEAVRPWQHVLNPLAGYLILAAALAGSPEHATAFNFGPPEEDARPVGWLAERLGTLWGRPLGVVPQGGEHPPEARTLRLDSSRARQRLGWHPAWDLEEGLRATVEWYRAHAQQADLRALSLAQVEAYAAAAERMGQA
jgi:CDP-glucose 4,6-dehydratase